MEIWDLVLAMGHQVRMADGFIAGWDLGTGLALASARGLNAFVAAELLPAVEGVAIPKMNEQIRAYRDE